MKIQSLKNAIAASLLVFATILNAQVNRTEPLQLGAVAPYSIEVTFDKTSHIIFPSGIRYVDLGSDYIIAGKADDADNVLRIKAAAQDFGQETNFSVITEDGNFFGFNACYSDAPQELSYNLIKLQTESNRSEAAQIRFEDLGKTPASVAGLLMQALYEKDRKTVKHIKTAAYGITFSLQGLYVHEGKYYFNTKIENQTYVPFVVDFIKFKIVDRKVARRTVIQERALTPLRMYRPLEPVMGNATEKNIFLLDVFTLSEGQVLLIEVFEKNGGRGQVLKLKNADLVRAIPLDKLKLKI